MLTSTIPPTSPICRCCRLPRRQSSPPQNFKIEKASQISLGLLAASVPVIARYLHSVHAHVSGGGNASEWVSSFAWIAIGTLLSFYLQHITKNRLAEYLIPHLRTHCEKPIDPLAEKVGKVADNLRGFLIDLLIFGVSTMLTINSESYPVGFGGSLDVSAILTSQLSAPSHGARVILLVVLGHYFERTCFEVSQGRKSPIFLTKLTHHLLTILLITACLATGYTRLGVPVILTHTLTGIFLCLSRLLNETVFTDMHALNYILLIVTWFYSRVWVFLVEIIVPLAKGLAAESELVQQFWTLHVILFVFLLMLFAFDLYWGTQLAVIGIERKIIRLQFEEFTQISKIK
jgi:hypothetical protein